MNVGLNLIGRLGPDADREGWLQEIEGWFHRQCAGTLLAARYDTDALGRTVLFLQLHPLARGTRVRDLGEGGIQVVADTAPIGPGYHVFHCELLRKLALAFDITWERGNHERGTGDPTGYFETGDEMGLYRAVLSWFQEQATAALVTAQDTGRPVALLLPESVTYTADEPVITPMGPKSLAWLELVASRPPHAIAIFPWWQPGQGPRSLLTRALAQMWTEVRWRPPITEAERGLLTEISALLEEVMGAEPTLELPWREWEEILRYLGSGGPLVEEVAARADTATGPLVGYRRTVVRRRILGGWSMEIPGSFAEKWEDRSTWVGWEEDRSIWLTCFQNRTGKAPEIPAHLALGDARASYGEMVDYQSERVLGSAVLDHEDDEEGRRVWQLQTRSAVAGHLAVSTVCFLNEDERPWAMSTWRSLEHESVPTPEAPSVVVEVVARQVR